MALIEDWQYILPKRKVKIFFISLISCRLTKIQRVELERMKNFNQNIEEINFSNIKTSISFHYLQSCKQYIALPSLCNPWYIISADDQNVIKYFVLNILSSRTRKRRFLIAIIRLLTRIHLQRLWLFFVPRCYIIPST